MSTEPLLPIVPKLSASDAIVKRIDILSEEVWERTISRVDIENWLANFNGKYSESDEEKLHALHLLANFSYFGVTEIRELLKSIYRDLFKYPIVRQIRSDNNGTTDPRIISDLWNIELNGTRFLGMGNPSESGSHLLYYFRQVNKLKKNLFLHQHQILDRSVGAAGARIAIPGLRRLVFIDDVLGSGQQANEYSSKFVKEVKRAAANDGQKLDVEYFVLFAKQDGLKVARATDFDRVEAIHELGSSELAFSDDSRIYVSPPNGVSLESGKNIAEKYGRDLYPSHPLGYRRGELLLGFHHNIPDNTLPIFWSGDDEAKWTPAFPRFPKV